MTPDITSRAELGWGPTKAPSARPTRGLVIHYDGSNRGLARKSHSACLDYWQWCRSFHTGERGWLDIGYSWAACPHGVILEGRGLGRAQAAQPGGNETWYSVTLMSGPAEDPTPEQITAVRRLRAWLIAAHGLGTAVRGHRDFVDTSCPGDPAYALVRSGTFRVREDPDVSASEVWRHEIPVPFGRPENPEWQARNILVDVAKRVRQLQGVVEAQAVTIERLAEALATTSPADPETLLSGIREAIESITIRLVAEGQADPPEVLS